VLKFQDIPFLYTPYIEFPVGDKCRSGLLVPSFGTSTSRGFELVVPWYWNIAPNQDATIAPHHMRRRGLQLDTQYRYLTKTTDGTFDLNYLHEDRITLEKRWSLKYLQNTSFTNNIRLKIDYKDVSDTEYLQDFSSSLLGTSTTHLSQSADIAASYTNWHMHAQLQTYETLDLTIAESDRPYSMLPKLVLRGDEELTDYMNFTLDSEWVNFVHESDLNIEGPRFLLQPGIELSLQESAWFLKPSLEFSHTQYNVNDGSGNKVDTPVRNIPIASLDSGLFFERTMLSNLIRRRMESLIAPGTAVSRPFGKNRGTILLRVYASMRKKESQAAIRPSMKVLKIKNRLIPKGMSLKKSRVDMTVSGTMINMARSIRAMT
jgi:LPS-assembly protein